MKYKREFLRAINKLIKHYKGFDGEDVVELINCPLCKVGRSRTPRGTGVCYLCPWVIFDEIDCDENDFYFHTKTQRLERLERWKKLIKEM